MEANFLVMFMAFAITVQRFILCEKREGTEKRLFRKLFKNYSPSPRPTKSAGVPVIVKFGVALNQILDLDEKKQTLISSVWITESWTDYNLMWSTTEYDGLDTLIVASSFLWNPDIFIFNAAGGKHGDFVNVTGGRLEITNNGQVTWLVPLMIKSSCKVDATYFPYDEQACDIHFGSWIYDETQLDLQPFPPKPNLDNYVVNSEFDLLGVTMKREIGDEKCCPGSGKHPMIMIQIKMKRKSIYYDYIVIAPTMLLSILSLFSFFLPSYHGNRISIGLTVFLTLYVLQLLISENVPDTNTTPILGIFTFLVMTLNCTSLIIATVVMNVNSRAKLNPIPEVPPLLLKFCNEIARIIKCFKFSYRANHFDLCTDEKMEHDTKNKNIQKTDNFSIGPTDIDKNVQNIQHDDLELADILDDSGIVYSETSLVKNNSSCPLIEYANNEEKDKFRTNRQNFRRSYKLALVNGLTRLRKQSCEGIKRFNNDTIANANLSNENQIGTIDDVGMNSVVLSGNELNDLQKQMIRKHDWYFVAETLDQASFIVYVTATFITIMTVLVIVPSCI